MGLFGEIDQLLQVPATLARIETKLDTLLEGQQQIMGMVKVSQESLDAIDQALDESTAALAEKIAALDLPEGDLTPIMADIDNIRNLHTPAPAEPTGDEPQVNPLDE